MPDIISEETPVANKHYRCMASAILIEADNSLAGLLTFAERRAVIAAKRNHFRIVPGQKYYCQTNTDGGEIYRWRAIPAMFEIVSRLDWLGDE